MNFTDALFPQSWLAIALAAYLILLLQAVRYAPWNKLQQPALLHIFLATCVIALAVWNVKAGIKPGLNLHMLGATIITLMFGPWLAMIALSSVLLLSTLFGAAGLGSLPMNGLIMIALPVTVSYGLFRLVDEKLPNHFFIYILLNGFIGGALAMTATGLFSTWLLAAADAYPLEYLYREYTPYYLLMGWSEAFITGLIMTMLVVYKPEWVWTFDDKRYLNK